MKKGTLILNNEKGLHHLDVAVAGSTLARMRGLLWKPQLKHHEGMLLRACNLIHTFGMRYPIDVVFLRRDGHVLKVFESVLPRRVRGHLRAQCVLELAAGAVTTNGIHPGMRLPIETL